MISIKESGTFKEIDIMLGDQKIGSAEVNTDTHELTMLRLYEDYQNKGYGKYAMSELTKRYQINRIDVRADNERAKKLYEKFGFRVAEPSYYKMELVKDCKSCKHGWEDERFLIPMCHYRGVCEEWEKWESKY